MKCFKKFTIVLLLLLPVSAQGGVLVEPFLGLTVSGSQELSYSNSALNDDASYDSGTSFGVRLGYDYLGWMFGLDYRINSFNGEGDSGGSTYDFNQTSNVASLFVGFQFPMMFRIYAGFGVSGSGTLEYGVFDYDVEDVSQTTLGFGYSILPTLAVNLEVVNYTFADISDSSGTYSNVELVGDHILLSVSAPFTF